MKNVIRIASVIGLAAPILLGAVSVANRIEKKSTSSTNLQRVVSTVEKEAPDTNTDNSPSVPPTLDAVTASSGDVQALSTVLESASIRTARPKTPVASPAGAASNYAIDWYSINGGGTVDAASTNYRLGASIGQSVAGAAVSTNYQMGIGFWYGAGVGGCACDCHGDPGGPCDGFTNILDVAQVVNAAFRNYPLMIDPNAACPYQTPDVNCSGDAEVIDVVKMVNVAFRNGNPVTEFCNPCP